MAPEAMGLLLAKLFEHHQLHDNAYPTPSSLRMAYVVEKSSCGQGRRSTLAGLCRAPHIAPLPDGTPLPHRQLHERPNRAWRPRFRGRIRRPERPRAGVR